MHYTVSCSENTYPYHNDAVGLLKRKFFNKVRKPFFSDVLPFFLTNTTSHKDTVAKYHWLMVMKQNSTMSC